MSQSIEALVTPSVMKWARERSRLDISAAAKRIGRTEDVIQQWESEDGEIKPTLAQLRKAAEVYKSALAVFFLPEPPEGMEVLRDFRCLPSERSSGYTPELAFLIRMVDNRRSWLSEWRSSTGEDPLDYIGSANINSEPSSVAHAIREKLNITFQDQKTLRTRRNALNFWAERVEEIGINVCFTGEIECEEARGFSLNDKYAPFIWINSSDARAGRLFTLTHELAHIWINTTGISNLENIGSNVDSEKDRIEIFCNSVASLTLLEECDFINLWKETDDRGTIEKRITSVSNNIQVSEEVVARRLLNHRIIDNAQYNLLRKHYIERWKNLRDDERKKMQESEYGPPPHLLRVIKNGRTFSRTVLIAYFEGRVSGLEASRLLDWKINNFPKLAKHAGLHLTNQEIEGGEI